VYIERASLLTIPGWSQHWCIEVIFQSLLEFIIPLGGRGCGVHLLRVVFVSGVIYLLFESVKDIIVEGVSFIFIIIILKKTKEIKTF
jgi:hypothetical protein